MIVLGLNTGLAASHDVSACVVDSNGNILSAIEEERLTRTRHAPGRSPVCAIDSCLREAGVSWNDLTHIAIGWDEPRLWRRVNRDERTPRQMLDELGAPRSISAEVVFVPHHEAHAWSVIPLSPFGSCLVYVLDGNGEHESTSVFRYDSDVAGQSLELLTRMPRASSLGYLFEATSEWLGLGRLAAGKTMGLAAYARGEELTWCDSDVMTWESDGWWTFFGGDPGLDYDELQSMWSSAITARFGGPMQRARASELHRSTRAVSAAWAAQNTVEYAIESLVNYYRNHTGLQEACFAGGVALNCAATGRLTGPRFTPPWPHDGGVAIGAAWAVVKPKCPSAGPFLGPAPDHMDLSDADRIKIDDFDLDKVVDRLMREEIGAICFGSSEFGPRALGNRSIIAMPTDSEMKNIVNRCKKREPWRPFGPATTSQGSRLWSDISYLDRYMVGAAEMTPAGRQLLPSVTHIDGTTRPQVVSPYDTGPFASVIREMERQGVPAILNTSFNGPGEPIVQTAKEALNAFRKLELDFLIIGDKIVTSR